MEVVATLVELLLSVVVESLSAAGAADAAAAGAANANANAGAGACTMACAEEQQGRAGCRIGIDVLTWCLLIQSTAITLGTGTGTALLGGGGQSLESGYLA